MGSESQPEEGCLKASLKYIPEMNSLTTEYQHLTQITAILLILII